MLTDKTCPGIDWLKCNVTVEGFVASSVSFFPSGVGPSTTGLSGLTHSGSVAFFSEASVFSVTVVASLETSVFFSTSVAFSLGASVVASLSDTAATSLANEETGAVLNATEQARVSAKRFL